MRKFVTFIFGVTIGVVITLYYELAAKQPQPRIARHNVVMSYESDDLFPFVDMDIHEMSVIELQEYAKMKAKDNTQFVKVDTSGGELPPNTGYLVGDDKFGAWQLDQWQKESE